MRKFTISDEFTTSDIGVNLQADTLAGLFTAGAEGMFEIILGGDKQRPVNDQTRIDLRAESPEQLLVDWLSELLYKFDAEGMIPREYTLDISDDGSEYSLISTVGCAQYDPGTDEAEHEIKAVTYYKLKIEKDDDIYRCHVVFDL